MEIEDVEKCDKDRICLIKIWENRGVRNPKNPFKTLSPTHQFSKLIINKAKLELEIDFEKFPEKSEQIFKEIENLENKIEIEKEKL